MRIVKQQMAIDNVFVKKALSVSVEYAKVSLLCCFAMYTYKILLENLYRAFNDRFVEIKLNM